MWTQKYQFYSLVSVLLTAHLLRPHPAARQIQPYRIGEKIAIDFFPLNITMACL